MRQFNTRLFFALLGSTAALGVGLFAVHWLQTGRIAQALLYQARRAEEQGQTDQAARYLGRYLEFNPSDLPERANLGRALASMVLDDAKPDSPRTREKALFVLEQVVAQDGGQSDLRLRLIKVAMIERRYDLALKHLKELPEDAETLELDGRCHEAENRYPEAADAYWKAIQSDEHRRDAYSRLAALLKRPNAGSLPVPVKSADEVLDLMVQKNGDSPQAYLTRWRHRPATAYKDEKRLQQGRLDVAAALKLAPEDADVLLAAGELAMCEGMAAEEKVRAGDANAANDRDAAWDRARDHLQQAIKLNPKDRRTYLTLAQVETTAEKTDAALAALDQGLKALPGQFDLLWMQANLLLDNGKDPAMLARARAVLEELNKSRASPAAA